MESTDGNSGAKTLAYEDDARRGNRKGLCEELEDAECVCYEAWFSRIAGAETEASIIYHSED